MGCEMEVGASKIGGTKTWWILFWRVVYRWLDAHVFADVF